ncbi:MAG: CBS domain-containing protein [Vulcanisaeta sp.]
MPILARDVMTTRVIMLNESSSVINAVDLMVSHGFRHVPIIRENSVVGVVTALDIIRQVDKSSPQVLSGLLKDLSTFSSYVKASPEDGIDAVVNGMRGGIDVALVFEENNVVGIITERDLVHKLPDQLFSRRRVFDAMSRDPITLDIDFSLGDAIKTMAMHNVRHLIITRGNRAMGVLSVRDVLRHFKKQMELRKSIDLNVSVSQLMSHNLITIDPSATIIDAVHLMRSNSISSLPVVEQGRLMGIITERDLIREIKL